jgi:predicted nucleotidyltransferase
VTLPEWAEGIGAYGSWGTGTNTGESDLDLWVYGTTPPASADLARLQRSLREQLSTEVNLLVLTPGRIQNIRDDDPPFFASFSSSMVTIRGNPVVLS